MDPPEGYEFYNLYGPTEGTVCVTAHRVTSRETNVAIGPALDNVHLYVVLAEVEGVVREFPGVTDATVVAFDKPSGGKYVAAYVVSGEEVGPAELSAFIRERKPPYMVPEVVMQIDAIPLRVSGGRRR